MQAPARTHTFALVTGPVNTEYLYSLSYQMDCSLKPSQRTDMLGRRNKGKRGLEENGGGPLSEPEEGAPHSYSSSCWNKSKNKRRKIEVSQRLVALQGSNVFFLHQTEMFTYVSCFLLL